MTHQGKNISTHYSLLPITGFPGGSVGKEFSSNAGDRLQCKGPELDPWVGKISWRRKWQLIPVCLPGKNPMDRGAWQATVHWGPRDRNEFATKPPPPPHQNWSNSQNWYLYVFFPPSSTPGSFALS